MKKPLAMVFAFSLLLLLCSCSRKSNIDEIFKDTGIYQRAVTLANKDVIFSKSKEPQKTKKTEKIKKPIVVIDFLYDDILKPSEGLTPVMKNGYWGYIDQSGKVIIDFLYKKAQSFKYGRAVVSKGNKFGLIDKKGNTVASVKYPELTIINDTVALIGWSGLLNIKTGKEIIPPEYFNMKICDNGTIHCKENGYSTKYFLFNMAGDIIWEGNNDVIEPCLGEFNIISKFGLGGKYDYNYIDKDLNLLLKKNSSMVYPFVDGRGLIYDESNWMQVDRQGNIVKTVVSPKKKTGSDFYDEYYGKTAIVRILGKEKYMVNLDTEEFFGPYSPKQDTRYGSYEIVRLRDVEGSVGLFDLKQGKLNIANEYDSISHCNENVFYLKLGNKGGYALGTGKIIIPLSEGIKFGKINDGVILIENKKGNYVSYDDKGNQLFTSDRFSSIDPFKDGYAVAYKDQVCGLIDKNGNEVLAPLYNSIKWCDGDLVAVKSQRKWGIVKIKK